jgi:hypothetical protein
MPKWRRSYVHVLVGTNIELHPEGGSDWWFVVDTRGGKEKVLGGALPLAQAKKKAVEVANA